MQPPQFPFVLGVVHIEQHATDSSTSPSSTSTNIRTWMATHAPHVPLYIHSLHHVFQDTAQHAERLTTDPASHTERLTIDPASHAEPNHDGQQNGQPQDHDGQQNGQTHATPHQSTTKLNNLVQSITDVTGREDLLVNLRHRLLLQVARAHGYTRLILGDTQTTAAVRVVAAACKGQGYVLPTLVAAYDARYGEVVGVGCVCSC